MTDVERVGRLVREYRTRRGVSQADLAGMAGVSIATISRIERADHEPAARIIHKLAFVAGREYGEQILDAAGYTRDGFRFIDDHGGAVTPEEAEEIARGLTVDELDELRRFADWLRSKHHG